MDLVIVDELGYLGLGPEGPLLFQFFAERYESGLSDRHLTALAAE